MQFILYKLRASLTCFIHLAAETIRSLINWSARHIKFVHGVSIGTVYRIEMERASQQHEVSNCNETLKFADDNQAIFMRRKGTRHIHYTGCASRP